jgi:hypothetical protein
MPTNNEFLSLSIQMNSKYHSLAEVAFIIESLDNLTMASVLGSMVDPLSEDRLVVQAREILDYSIKKNPSSKARFYPNFFDTFSQASLRSRENQFLDSTYIYGGFNPGIPMDVGMQVGINSWVRREIYLNDPKLYNALFSFTTVRKLEHYSPLIIEVSVLILGGLLIVPVLMGGCIIALNKIAKKSAETDIRQSEAQLKKEEVKQQIIRTQIMETLRDTINEKSANGQLRIPDSVLAETARIAQSTVSDLKDNPLIGQLTIGFSTGN